MRRAFTNNTWLIARREYTERVRTKGFILTTVLIPVLMGALVFGGGYLASRTKSSAHIAVVAAGHGLCLRSETEAGRRQKQHNEGRSSLSIAFDTFYVGKAAFR